MWTDIRLEAPTPGNRDQIFEYSSHTEAWHLAGPLPASFWMRWKCTRNVPAAKGVALGAPGVLGGLGEVLSVVPLEQPVSKVALLASMRESRLVETSLRNDGVRIINALSSECEFLPRGS